MMNIRTHKFIIRVLSVLVLDTCLTLSAHAASMENQSPSCSLIFTNSKIGTGSAQLGSQFKIFEAQNNDEFLSVLYQFRGSADQSMNIKMQGGEGQIFLSDRDPFRALKRFFKHSVNSWRGVELLEDAENQVSQSQELSNLLEIAKIYDRGSDWILRDYDRSSVPLTQVKHNDRIINIRSRIINILSRSTNPTLLLIKKKIERNPPSINIHWSPVTNKIFIFDLTQIQNQYGFRTFTMV